MQRFVLRSADLEVDEGVHCVRLGGRLVELAPRVFDLLVCLMRRAPKTVTRDVLVTEVWRDVHVCESAITQAVRTLRRAIERRPARPGVVTVRGRGYRFDGDVIVVAPPSGTVDAVQSFALPRLLVVDDEPEILDALRRTLRGTKCQLLFAKSGREALDIVARERVDGVLSDIDMPGMSGLELLGEVRRSHPSVVRLILTGVATLETAVRAINDGQVQRFLTKPWSTEELRAVIREVFVDHPALEPDRGSDAASRVGAGLTPALSPRERDTLRELMTGAPEKEIAVRLGVSPHTAHQYVKALYRRFEVASRVQLIVKLGPGRLSRASARMGLPG